MKTILSLFLAIGASLVVAEDHDDLISDSPVFRAEVDNIDGHQYQSFREPVAVKTQSGRVLVGVHAGNRLSWPERSGQDLVIRYSDDNGKSWSPLIIAAEHGNFSCQSHGLVYDAQKNRLLFLYVTYNWDYSSIDGRGPKFTAPVYQKLHDENKPAMSAYLVYSDDEGVTWSDPRDITDMCGGDAHFGASEGRQLTVGKHAGRLLSAGGDNRTIDPTGRLPNKDSGDWISDDHGAHWRFSEIDSKLVKGMACEGRVTELPNGGIVYNGRLSQAQQGRSVAFSDDGGDTWRDVGIERSLSSAKSNGCTITLENDEDELTNTLWLSVPVGRLDNCTLFISKDGGKTWEEGRKVISGRHVKYSALLQLDTASIGLFYETSHYKDICFKELKVADFID